MTVITVSIPEDVEKQFRRFAEAKYKKKKGYFGKALTKAMEKILQDEEQEEVKKRAFALLERGFKMGEVRKISRDELHERH